tara:strand:+ start:1201 stop:2433 length:1233 start_codon:yes stop_codon:yes gene_type:complete
MTDRPYQLDGLPKIEGELPSKGISHSALSKLSDCPLQGTLSILGVSPMLAFSIDAALGTAIHKFLDHAGKGDYEDLDESVLKEKLEHEIENQTELVEKIWYARNLLPLSLAKDSSLKKGWAIKQALVGLSSQGKKVEDRHETKHRDDVMEFLVADRQAPIVEPTGPIGGERPLSTEDGFLHGEADRLYKDSDGVYVIEDWKTGEILDNNGKLKMTVVDQLKNYGLMLYDKTGQVPRLIARPLKGDPIPVECFEQELNDRREMIDDEFSQKKEHLAKLATSEERYSQLADPKSPSVCKFCSYRPICSTYHNKNFVTEPELRQLDCIGTITEITSGIDGTKIIKIKHPHDDEVQTAIFRKWSLSRHPALNDIDSGDDVGVFNAWAGSHRRVHRDQRNTVVYKYAYGPFKSDI